MISLVHSPKRSSRPGFVLQRLSRLAGGARKSCGRFAEKLFRRVPSRTVPMGTTWQQKLWRSRREELESAATGERRGPKSHPSNCSLFAACGSPALRSRLRYPSAGGTLSDQPKAWPLILSSVRDRTSAGRPPLNRKSQPKAGFAHLCACAASHSQAAGMLQCLARSSKGQFQYITCCLEST